MNFDAHSKPKLSDSFPDYQLPDHFIVSNEKEADHPMEQF
jgi:hypothetical protein